VKLKDVFPTHYWRSKAYWYAIIAQTLCWAVAWFLLPEISVLMALGIFLWVGSTVHLGRVCERLDFEKRFVSLLTEPEKPGRDEI